MSLQQENPINLAAAIFPHQTVVQCIQKKTEEDSPHEPELAHPPTIKATSIGQQAFAGASEDSGIPKTMDSHVVQPSQSASPDRQSIPEDYAIEAVVSQPHLLAHIFAFLEGKDAAHAEQACHTFQNGRHLANIQRVKNVAALWGIEDLSFSVDPTSHIRLTADDKLPAIIDRLREINSALPERFRSHNSIDVASSNPSWLLGFFQRAYDCQVLSTFGRAAHVAQQSSFETQLHTVFEWLEKGQSAWLTANKR